MALLVVDRRGSRIELDGAALVIRVPDERPRTVPVRQIHLLVIAGAVDLDARVCTRLGSSGAGIVFLPGRGSRSGIVVSGSGHGDARRRLGQYALASNPEARLGMARRIVRMRIHGGMRLVAMALRSRPDQRRILQRSRKTMLQSSIRTRDITSVDVLLGLEGTAASALFSALAAVLPDSVGFSGRNRRPPRDPVNAALSLGYTLLQGEAQRALAEAGLDPMLGFLHEPASHRDSLACDLVELARSRVEWMVWRLFAEEALTAASFTTGSDGCRLGKQGRARFFAAFARMSPLPRKWFRSAAREIARICIDEGARHV